MAKDEEIDVRQQPLEILRKHIRSGYRYLLRRPLPDELTRQLELEEAWNDMARAAQGKRILQRLNGGQPGVPPSYDAFRRTLRTFGGLEPSGPPKTGTRQLIKGPGIGDPFQTEYMKRIRRYSPPSLPEYKPKFPELTPRSRFPADQWKVPTGRRDPYPREITKVPISSRQDWLRTYYRTNPRAAQQARSEARTIIDWAHRYLR